MFRNFESKNSFILFSVTLWKKCQISIKSDEYFRSYDPWNKSSENNFSVWNFRLSKWRTGGIKLHSLVPTILDLLFLGFYYGIFRKMSFLSPFVFTPKELVELKFKNGDSYDPKVYDFKVFRIHQCKSLLFKGGVSIYMYLKILDLLVNVVYGRTIWHKFSNKPLVLFIEGRFVKVNGVLSLSAETFVCLRKGNQCLLICSKTTEMGQIFNFISR